VAAAVVADATATADACGVGYDPIPEVGSDGANGGGAGRRAEQLRHIREVEVREVSAGRGNGGAGEAGEELREKGTAAFKAGRFDEAAALYTAALDAGGGAGGVDRRWRATVLSNRAMTFMKLGAHEEAENDCTSALLLDAAHVKAFLRRGACRSLSGYYSEAIADFESALRVEPKNKDAKAEISRLESSLQEGHITHTLQQ
jgi:tetratricopeptide (TPR) repeat protein